METAVILIMFLVGLSFVLKLTFMRPAGALAEAVAIAAFVYFSSDLAASGSKTQIQEWLSDSGMMLDIAVLLTVDVALQIAFCLSEASSSLTLTGRIIRCVLLYLPGILIFPTVFACLVEFIFALTGADFSTIGLGWGAALFVGLPLLAVAMKYLLPERPLRLELMFYANCIIALLGVIATVNGRTAVAGVSELSLPALLLVAGIFIAGGAAGIILYNRKSNKHA